MRTEHQLREAFATLADRPHPADPVQQRILARTAPSAIRRRRALFVLAAVVVVVLALMLPNVLVNRTVVPADTRAPGNWNLIHSVNLPPGWEVDSQQVGPRSEMTVVRPTDTEPGTESCSIDIAARGRYQPVASPDQRQPVEINGRPGFYVAPTTDMSVTTGVFWTYTDDSWANVDCSLNGEPVPDQSLEIARRIVFTPTPLLVPFRLRSLPNGYVPSYVQQGHIEGSDLMSVGVVLDASVPDDRRPQIGISVGSGPVEVPPGIPGYETDTVRGYPAVLNAREGSLSLNVGDRTVRIVAEGGEPADRSVSLWAAGRRELLLDVAGRLKLANLTDSSTWYDANRAVDS